MYFTLSLPKVYWGVSIMIKSQHLQSKAWRLLGAFIVLIGWVFGLLVATAGAAMYVVPYSVAGDRPLSGGTVVVFEKEGSVRAARHDEARYVIGAVAPLPKDSLAAGKVGVVSSGIVSVVVSNQNGPIKKGDRITLSAIEGVAMKAQAPGWIIGVAQTDFLPTSGAAKQQVITGDGRQVPVALKEIPLLLSVSYYGSEQSTGALGWLQAAAEVIAGHEVPLERAIWAALIFAISIILLVAFVASAVKQSLIAIGRNPMANGKIAKSLVRVLMTAFGVIAVTLVIIYFILQ